MTAIRCPHSRAQAAPEETRINRRTPHAPSMNPTMLDKEKPMRTLEELQPLVQRSADNPDIVRQYREAVGSEDRVRATALIDAITEFAQSIDPTVTHVEGVRITVGLMKMVGHLGKLSEGSISDC